jgi:NAD-dependent dihydropyrimidine dehydrogenase PreA subunit
MWARSANRKKQIYSTISLCALCELCERHLSVLCVLRVLCSKSIRKKRNIILNHLTKNGVPLPKTSNNGNEKRTPLLQSLYEKRCFGLSRIIKNKKQNVVGSFGKRYPVFPEVMKNDVSLFLNRFRAEHAEDTEHARDASCILCVLCILCVMFHLFFVFSFICYFFG